MPFSDPMADGPTIQESSVRSIANGTKINDILEIVRRLENLIIKFQLSLWDIIIQYLIWALKILLQSV